MTTVDQNRIRDALQRSLDQELPPPDAAERVLLRFRETVAGRGARASASTANRRMLAGLLVAATVAIVGGTLAGAIALRNHGLLNGSPAKHPVVLHTPAPTASGPPVQTAPNGGVTGFQPLSVTAVSEQQFWVLGTGGFCSSCSAAILHTQDGGNTFAALPTPPFLFAHDSQSPEPTTISDLRFADSMDGWAFDPGLWSTHDGGFHWTNTISAAGGAVRELEPGSGGYVYAVADRCTNSGTATLCIRQLRRATSSANSWTTLLQFTAPLGPPPSLGVHGTSVWLMDGRNLWTSSDAGTHFTKNASPCEAELGGSVDPVSSQVLWAFCPTGSLGAPWRSTDGGRKFALAGSSPSACENGAMVSALSATTAFFIGCGSAGLAETRDGGQSYRAVSAVPGASWVGFTDQSVGYVLVRTADAMHSQLWRTSDSGVRWTQLRFS